MNSGKFVVRIDPALHGKLQEISRTQGISLNQLCRLRLAQNTPLVDPSKVQSFDLPSALQNAILALNIPIEGLVLFGSQVRGDATDFSDTDLLIVLQAGAEITRDLYAVWDERMQSQSDAIDALKLVPHFAALPASVSEAGSLWLEVSLNGTVLWEKSRGRVKRFLFTLREAIAEGQFQRKSSHGHPYWVRGTHEE